MSSGVTTLLKTYNTHPDFLLHSFQSRYSPLTSTTTSSMWVRRFRGLVKRTRLPRVLGLWRVLCSNSESSSDDCLCVTTSQCSTWWHTWTGTVWNHITVFSWAHFFQSPHTNLKPAWHSSTFHIQNALKLAEYVSQISSFLWRLAKIVTQQTLSLIKQWPKKHLC